MVLVGTLYFATTALAAIWSPLAWLVPGAAGILLVVLLWRAMSGST
jgi:hypothetical protein